MLLPENLAPTEYQQKVLAFRRVANIFEGGGRGSGKSVCLSFDAIGHAMDMGPQCSALITRESWSGTVELMQRMLQMAHVAFNGGVSMNKSEGIITLPTGGNFTFTQVDDESSYSKHLGKSRSGLFADEVGNYPPNAFKFLQLLRSNLRLPVGLRTHQHYSANPKGRAHHLMLKNFVNRAPWWSPYREDPTDPASDFWVNTSSTLIDNPHIDQRAYKRQLLAATGSDEKLTKAWIENDWSYGGNVLFANFNPAHHLRMPPPSHLRMRYQVGCDWGTASPAVGILLGQVLDYMGPYRPGDCFALCEADTVISRDDLSAGTGAPPSDFADMLKAMLAEHGCKQSTPVVCDDARGLVGDTVVTLLSEAGLWASKPQKKSRVGGFNLVRQMLANAITGEGPALWLTPRCPYLLETLPEMPRNPLREEDGDPKYNKDHAIDALVYGLTEMYGGPGAANGTVTGQW